MGISKKCVSVWLLILLAVVVIGLAINHTAQRRSCAEYHHNSDDSQVLQEANAGESRTPLDECVNDVTVDGNPSDLSQDPTSVLDIANVERNATGAASGDRLIELMSDPDIAEASKEFKNNPGFRHGSAKKLIPYLTTGLSKDEVSSLLGNPDKIDERGALWEYVLFYSLFIDIQFLSFQIL